VHLPDRLRPYPVAAFAGVTLLIWGNRVWLAWSDQDASVAGKVGSSVPITAFVVAAVVVLGLQLRGASCSRGFPTLVKAFAGGTIMYWAIRLPVIVVHGHPLPFKVVHSALAAVSAGLAVGAWRAIRGEEQASAGRPRRDRSSLQSSSAAR